MLIEASVVICVRNGAAVIRRQLDALDAQIDHPVFEIVIVDNGSRDGTMDVVRAWQDEPSHAAAGIRVVHGQLRPSIPRSRNLGVQESSGRVILFCDADDEVEPRWVGSLARAIDGGQLAGGRILARDVDGSLNPTMFGDGLIGTPYLPHVGNGNCGIARSTFEAVGGYDCSLPAYGYEDVDFSWRIQEAGFPIIYVPEARIFFTVSGNGASIRKKFMLGKGRVLMSRRFPAYDGRAFTIRSCVASVAREAMGCAGSSFRDRRVDRAAASRFVASVGRLVGSVRYSVGGVPARQLMDTGMPAE